MSMGLSGGGEHAVLRREKGIQKGIECWPSSCWCCCWRGCVTCSRRRSQNPDIAGPDRAEGTKGIGDRAQELP